jgi:hypothetical protein
MGFCLDLHMRIVESYIGDFSIVVIESSRSWGIFGFHSYSVQSFNDLLFCLSITKPEFDSAGTYTFVCKRINVSSGIDYMSYSCNLFKLVNLSLFG